MTAPYELPSPLSGPGPSLLLSPTIARTRARPGRSRSSDFFYASDASLPSPSAHRPRPPRTTTAPTRTRRAHPIISPAVAPPPPTRVARAACVY